MDSLSVQSSITEVAEQLFRDVLIWKSEKVGLVNSVWSLVDYSDVCERGSQHFEACLPRYTSSVSDCVFTAAVLHRRPEECVYLGQVLLSVFEAFHL